MPLDFRQLGLAGSRGEKVDTARMLLVAEALDDLSQHELYGGRWPLARLAEVLDIPVQNDVPRADRAREMLKVWRYYSDGFLESAYRWAPPWHLLTEPTRWDNVEAAEVEDYLGRHLANHGAWPTIGKMRTAFGRQSNHRPAAERTPGQESMEIDA